MIKPENSFLWLQRNSLETDSNNLQLLNLYGIKPVSKVNNESPNYYPCSRVARFAV